MNRTVMSVVMMSGIALGRAQTVVIPAGYNMLLTGGGSGQDGSPSPHGNDHAMEATLTNLREAIEVKVWSPHGEPLRGFGLGRHGVATVHVGPGERLFVSSGEGPNGKVKVECNQVDDRP